MPKYRKKDGTIVSFTKPVPKITQKMLGLRPARPVITVKDIEAAGKRRKREGGMVVPPRPRVVRKTKAKKASRPMMATRKSGALQKRAMSRKPRMTKTMAK
jgi:spore germination protein YaaH